ncbi:TetR/AcrR family transcriptional regulator C-terminal domain-containing protein [Actinokineospora soli]
MPKAERRAPLTRDRVLDVAVAVADTRGLDALSMRALGRELGVEAMSLYNHVSNKDDLLDAMVDRVVGEIDLGDGRTWRDRARARAVSAHGVLVRHPWAARLWTSRLSLGPARMRYMDTALRDLRDAGFAPGPLDSAYHTIENHIVGHALQAIGFPLAEEDLEQAGKDFLATFPTAEFPDLAAHIRHHIDHPTQGDGFEFGLDLILDGLEELRTAP